MSRKEWNASLKTYAMPSYKKAINQIVNTVVPYFIMLALTLVSFNQGLPIIVTGFSAIVAGLLMVRVFIMFHDCTHGSFTENKKLNSILGFVFGVMTFTPFESWKKEHGIHHGAVGNLDKRGTGDIWTLTIEEYSSKKWYVKGLYRLFRNPLFLFGVAPFFLFLVLNRIPSKSSTKKEVSSYMLTNLGIVVVGAVFSLIFGFKAYAIMQFVILFTASSAGVWLFYVQHQFEEVYWEDGDDWNSVDAALQGSTFYKLPVVFEWFSGYIGYHHIHHLNSKIPNYNLKQCYMDHHELKKVKTVNFRESIHLAFLQIYDKKNKRLVSFRRLQKNY